MENRRLTHDQVMAAFEALGRRESMAGITPAQLRDMADWVEGRWPDAVLVRNDVGNLIALVDGNPVAWCDLRFGGVNPF